jgi:hypothetical protein
MFLTFNLSMSTSQLKTLILLEQLEFHIQMKGLGGCTFLYCCILLMERLTLEYAIDRKQILRLCIRAKTENISKISKQKTIEIKDRAYAKKNIFGVIGQQVQIILEC